LSNYIDLTGRKFGKFTVISETSKRKPTMFLCKCECGVVIEVRSGDLINGSSKGCRRCTNMTHGMSKTHIYRVWADMKTRCLNVNSGIYKDYGKRGIKICETWVNSFESFKEWAIKNGYDEKLTIDRINNNGNYEPNNCRWTTMSVQNANKRLKKYTINNVSKTFPEWCKYTGLGYNLVYQRIHTIGESVGRAFRLNGN